MQNANSLPGSCYVLARHFTVVQGVYRLEPNLPRFYTRSGDIIESVLENYSIPSNVGHFCVWILTLSQLHGQP